MFLVVGINLCGDFELTYFNRLKEAVRFANSYDCCKCACEVYRIKTLYSNCYENYLKYKSKLHKM